MHRRKTSAARYAIPANAAESRPVAGAPRGRLRALVALGLVYLVVSSLLRAVLGWRFGLEAGASVASLAGALAVGVVNDAVIALALLLPLSLYLAVVPDRLYRSLLHRWLFFTATAAFLFAVVYLSAVEYFFFDEFSSRLNLVAVDYLMYPHEVLVNIWESYPVVPVMAVSLLAALTLAVVLWPVLSPGWTRPVRPRRRAVVFAGHVVLAAAALSLVSTRTLASFDNRVTAEVAVNGVSSFFEALRTNEIDYYTYYRSGSRQRMFRLLTDDLATGGEPFSHLAAGRLDRRFGGAAGTAGGLGDLDVVVIVEESLGAEFVGACGDDRGLTPELDALAERGVLFTRAYATGTRTVRGLEAIIASFPPIPSVSILRRPGSEGIANWGAVMRRHGYDTSFLYGGYSYFDNMRHFFAGNGFVVSDRADIPEPVFANIWGVSDEDLFRHALGTFDRLDGEGKRFFSVVLTTSNHKPFSFPPGVPGVPETGGGRSAGVRYADYALGRFFRQAAEHRWYDDTLFVVLGDHGARVYGAAEIPLYSYEIPILLLAPARLPPARVDFPTSQLDVAPTVLGLLGIRYEAPFFGQDVLGSPPAQPRVLLFNHNHDVAALRGDDLVVLGLHRRVAGFRYRAEEHSLTPEVAGAELTDLATAYYQTAYDQFEGGQYRLWPAPRAALDPPAGKPATASSAGEGAR